MDRRAASLPLIRCSSGSSSSSSSRCSRQLVAFCSRPLAFSEQSHSPPHSCMCALLSPITATVAISPLTCALPCSLAPPAQTALTRSQQKLFTCSSAAAHTRQRSSSHTHALPLACVSLIVHRRVLALTCRVCAVAPAAPEGPLLLQSLLPSFASLSLRSQSALPPSLLQVPSRFESSPQLLFSLPPCLTRETLPFP